MTTNISNYSSLPRIIVHCRDDTNNVTSSETWADLTTTTIPANTFRGFIHISCRCKVLSQTGANSGYSRCRITVNGSQVGLESAATGTSSTYGEHVTLSWYLIVTDVDFTQAITVAVQGIKVITSGSPSVDTRCYYLEVWGV